MRTQHPCDLDRTETLEPLTDLPGWPPAEVLLGRYIEVGCADERAEPGMAQIETPQGAENCPIGGAWGGGLVHLHGLPTS